MTLEIERSREEERIYRGFEFEFACTAQWNTINLNLTLNINFVYVARFLSLPALFPARPTAVSLCRM